MTPEEKAREHADFQQWESEIEFLNWTLGPTEEELAPVPLQVQARRFVVFVALFGASGLVSVLFIVGLVSVIVAVVRGLL